MNASNRMKILVGIFVIVLAWRVLDSEGPATDLGFAAPLFQTNQLNQRQERKLQQLRSLPALNFEVKPPKNTDFELGRNPFSFGIDQRAEIEKSLAVQEARTITPLETKPVVIEPVKPTFPGSVFGLIHEPGQGVKAAILLDEQVFLASKGDAFKDIYRVESISDLNIVIKNLQNGQEFQIKLESEHIKSWP